ncbi:DUF488 family protein, N3 subclade [Haloarchaeobius sp. DFWS5]|uniref:DUF488 family protein, N3 subclade n=1 Tax=Haloarchaeobius sp. DFWS5 TaxID=3446114 RepID=UPI003EB8244A
MTDSNTGPGADDGDSGTVRDTYVAALQHDLFVPTENETLVGVVRRPTRWFSAAVDENVPALGPPADLLDETKTAEEDLKRSGICGEEAHNMAWEQTDFEVRYRQALSEIPETRDAVDSVVSRLRRGENLVLVCYENTAKKRCHRTILADVLRDRLDD